MTVRIWIDVNVESIEAAEQALEHSTAREALETAGVEVLRWGVVE